MKKSLRKILLVLVILLLLPIVYFFICDIYFKGTTNDKKVRYLKNNSVMIDVRAFDMPAGFIDNPKKNCFNVFILGEFHGFSKTHAFDAEFFKYLNKNFGVRDYCSEFFTHNADSLNSFLSKDSMDSSMVYNVIANIAKDNIPQLNTEEYYQEWISLYKYNKTLPDSAKIRVHGLLGDKNTFNGNRDSEMAATMTKLKNDNKVSQNVYCLTGMYHAVQGRLEGSQKTFALRMKEKGFNTISIIQHTSNSMMFVPEGIYPMTPPNEEADFFNSDGWMYYFSHIKDLKAASKDDGVTLYKLNGENSPYDECHDFVDSRGPLFFTNWYFTPVEGAVTTDYFQYVLFINGQESPKKLIKDIKY